MTIFCDLKELRNESDVEQKLVFPILLADAPRGLAYSTVDIRTKPDIRALTIGKGNEKKLYYPDYVILIAGVPVLVIEVKGPNEDVQSALREARLYATELNAEYPTGINPCCRVLVTNGTLFLSSPWDAAEPDVLLEFKDIDPTNQKYDSFLRNLSRPWAKASADRVLQQFRQPRYFRPTHLLGGNSVRNEAIGTNTFGATVSAEYRHLFNPSTVGDRAYIARHGYISSKRREKYFNPINQIISASIPPSIADAKDIDTETDDNELVTALRNARDLEHEVLLLIGSVGSGKSTFVDRLREVALPRDVRDATVWVRLNMNHAPMSPSTIYDWVLTELIRGLYDSLPDVDFDEMGTIQKLFGPEIRRLMKGELSLLDTKSYDYKVALVREIGAMRKDKLVTVNALTRYVCAQRGRAFIVVFDNCDKGNATEQLLMFQVSQWLKEEFRCLVFLPLRDVTYDHHRDEAPLDTALKTLVFRIEPPLFTRVLAKRIELAFKAMMAKDRGERKILTYTLPNGWRVEYPVSDQGMYLMSILLSLFEHDRFIRRTIVGLAGRDVRRALEIFLEFCTSGHISESEIFEIRRTRGQRPLPFQVVTRVLLRLSRRFYDGDQSYLCNLFQCDPSDPRPDYLVRLAVLRWLQNCVHVKGPTGVDGYHRCVDLKTQLVPLGHDSNRLDSEIKYLVEKRCIVTEHQRIDVVDNDDLLCLSPSGWVHLKFLENIDYLSACGEDTWIGDELVARRISSRIGGSVERHYSLAASVDNATEFVRYLEERLAESFHQPALVLNTKDVPELHSLESSARSLDVQRDKIKHGKVWDGAADRYPPDTVVDAVVDGVAEFGVFVEIELGIVGLMHSSLLPPNFRQRYSRGDRIRVEIIEIEPSMYRASLKPST